MADTNIDGVVTWLKNWFYDKTEITGFLNNKANQSDLQTTNSNLSTLSSTVDNKVDKVTGKGLSTEDFTTAFKDKLDGIESEANKTVVDSALSSTSENPLQNKAINTALDGKAPKSHASSASTYGLGTTSNYGHVKTVNGLTQSSHQNGTALSAYQGKVLKDAIDTKANSSDVPTKTSELTNDSGFLTAHQDITGKEDKSNKANSWGSTPNDTRYPTEKLVKDSLDAKLNSSDAFSGSWNDLTNKPSTFAPSAHNQASTTITESSALSNIGTGANANQHTINGAIDTIIGNLSTIRAIEVVATKPTASASTMGKLYIVSENNKVNVYYTEQSGTGSSATYSWHKMDTDILDELTVDWSDVQNKPSTFTPSSHTHGYILNDGSTTTTKSSALEQDTPVIVDTEDNNKIKSGRIATGWIFDVNAYPNIGTSANASQEYINRDIDFALSGKGAKTDDIDWSYNSNGFTNGVKLVDKTTNAYGRITLHLKS